MKNNMRVTTNHKWIDVLPSLMIDWGKSSGIRIFFGWIYWTIEFN